MCHKIAPHVSCITDLGVLPPMPTVVSSGAGVRRPSRPAGSEGAGPASAPDRIAAVLRDEVLNGVLAPGHRLREEVLCARFGAGRHSVRAALRLLVSAGLAVHERHRGASVRPLTRARVEHTLSFRAVLELGSLRLALAHGADLSPVEAAVRELEALPEATPWRRAIEVHGRVHHEIVRAADNERLLDAYLACEDELLQLFAVLRPDFSVRDLGRLHRRLVDRVHRGGEAAVQALADDLELAGRAGVLHALERSEQVAAAADAVPRQAAGT